MKKLLILTAVAMLTTSALGCNSCKWRRWNRGTACNTCNTCATGSTIVGDGYSSYSSQGPLVTPGPSTIITPAPN